MLVAVADRHIEDGMVEEGVVAVADAVTVGGIEVDVVVVVPTTAKRVASPKG